MPESFTARTFAFAGVVLLTGCISMHRGTAVPPIIEIGLANVDESTGLATVQVTNHSRKRVLARTNELVWQEGASPRLVDRPDHYLGEDFVSLAHEMRLEPGESMAYLDVRIESIGRPPFPAIHVCWDNREWTCDRYWLIPAPHRWDKLVQNQQHRTDKPPQDKQP